MKLRTTVSQLAQYKDKNIKDAGAWIDTTTGSISNVISRLQKISNYCTQGSTDSFNETDRNSIIDTLKSYKEIIYSEGTTTYAGRYIFSGYKTDVSLTFDTQLSTENISYDIKESLAADSIVSKNIVKDAVDPSSVNSILAGGTYNSPTEASVYSMKLSYDNLDSNNKLKLTYQATDGSNVTLTPVILDTDKAPYYDNMEKELTYYIPETGEVVFGETVYNNIQNSIDPTSSIDVSYTKSEFEIGDLRPEHYFDCVKHTTKANGTVDDTTYTQPTTGQQIKYEVNFSQSMTVNVEGKDVIKHGMGNSVDAMAQAVQDVIDAEDKKNSLKNMLSDPLYSSNAQAVTQINTMLKDIDTEIALKTEAMQSLFGSGITTFNNYITSVTTFQSVSATRTNKLDLIYDRVTEQYATFKELMSSNEDVNTAEAIIEFNEAEQAYNLALSATSNVIQQTLLDYL